VSTHIPFGRLNRFISTLCLLSTCDDFVSSSSAAFWMMLGKSTHTIRLVCQYFYIVGSKKPETAPLLNELLHSPLKLSKDAQKEIYISLDEALLTSWLERLKEHKLKHTSESSAISDPGSLQIEHILPQNMKRYQNGSPPGRKRQGKLGCITSWATWPC
jgi:hypothetical protein